eukprot:scaffold24810_cov85-Skeletonema_dohrnii-CCMP3373.AAC.1
MVGRLCPIHTCARLVNNIQANVSRYFVDIVFSVQTHNGVVSVRVVSTLYVYVRLSLLLDGILDTFSLLAPFQTPLLHHIRSSPFRSSKSGTAIVNVNKGTDVDVTYANSKKPEAAPC